MGDAQPPTGAAGRLHKALARLTDPKYVEDTQGWRLITICVKATRDAAGSGAEKRDIIRVWDEWSRLAPSKYDRANNLRKLEAWKTGHFKPLQHVLRLAKKEGGVEGGGDGYAGGGGGCGEGGEGGEGSEGGEDGEGFNDFTDHFYSTSFVALYGQDFEYVDAAGSMGSTQVGGLRYFDGERFWLAGNPAKVAMRGLLAGPFHDVHRAQFVARCGGALADEEKATLAAMKRKLRNNDSTRANLEKAIVDELIRRKPKTADDLRFNTQDANHSLLCFKSRVMDMSRLVTGDDGAVNWQGAMRDYRREDYVTRGCHLPYDMVPLEDVQEHVDHVNRIINDTVPDPDNNYATRHWYAVCCTGEPVRKFLCHTGEGGKNGKSKLADMHMESLPYISLKMGNKAMNESCEHEHKLLRALQAEPSRFWMLEEIPRNGRIDKQRLCTLVDNSAYTIIQLGCEDTVTLHPQGKLNITGNQDIPLPDDGGVKNRAQQIEYTQAFLNDAEYAAKGGDSDPNIHRADEDLFTRFKDKADHAPKVAYVHVMLPFIAEFYAKGRKLLMSQAYSDRAVANVEEGCWVTAAVAGTLVFTGVVNDGRGGVDGAAENGPNWCDEANWLTQDALFAAIQAHPAAAPHRHGLEWKAFWVEAKAKIPRLKAARDPTKRHRDMTPKFFGVKIAGAAATEEKGGAPKPPYGFHPPPSESEGKVM